MCGAIAVGAFAYATLMEWTDLVVSNAEFQLYPVKRYAMGRLAQWTGFALGVVVAFFAFRAGDVAIEGLGELSCAARSSSSQLSRSTAPTIPKPRTPCCPS